MTTTAYLQARLDEYGRKASLAEEGERAHVELFDGCSMGILSLASDCLAHIRHLESQLQSIRAETLEEAAKECGRMKLYPGGRMESPAHQNVWEAARAIRKLGEIK